MRQIRACRLARCRIMKRPNLSLRQTSTFSPSSFHVKTTASFLDFVASGCVSVFLALFTPCVLITLLLLLLLSLSVCCRTSALPFREARYLACLFVCLVGCLVVCLFVCLVRVFYLSVFFYFLLLLSKKPFFIPPLKAFAFLSFFASSSFSSISNNSLAAFSAASSFSF